MDLFEKPLSRGRVRRAWRGATSLLLLTTLAFAVFSGVMMQRSERAGRLAGDLFQIAAVYGDLERALLNEEIVRHDVLFQGHSPAELAVAQRHVERAWQRVKSGEQVVHGDDVSELERPMSAYQAATNRAVAGPQGTRRLAAEVDALDRAGARITKGAEAEAAEHKVQALGALAQMQDWQSFSARAVSTLGVVYLVLVVGSLRLLARQQRRTVELGEKAHRASLTDELTGLANRGGLREGLKLSVLGESADRPVALVLLDLDGFKMVNDTYGHDFGDEVLKVVADRLRATAPPSSLIARLGGDEFVVVLADGSRNSAERFAAAAYDALTAAAVVQSIIVDVGASIGVALSEISSGRTGTSASELLRRADIAMYAAKTDQSGPVFFSSFLSVPAVGGRAGAR